MGIERELIVLKLSASNRMYPKTQLRDPGHRQSLDFPFSSHMSWINTHPILFQLFPLLMLRRRLIRTNGQVIVHRVFSPHLSTLSTLAYNFKILVDMATNDNSMQFACVL